MSGRGAAYRAARDKAAELTYRPGEYWDDHRQIVDAALDAVEHQADRPPPIQCVTCHRFVKVSTARRIEECGDYGTVLGVEFECERCAEPDSGGAPNEKQVPRDVAQAESPE